MLLVRIAEVSQAVGATSARLAKIDLLATALREAGPAEVPIAVAYLSGELPQRQIGVGWAALRDGFPPAAVPTLGLAEVDAAFSAIGSRTTNVHPCPSGLFLATISPRCARMMP